MNKKELLNKLNGIKIEYKKIIKLNEFKQLKKDLTKIADFTTKITQENDTTTKTQKISINSDIINNIKKLASEICNTETMEIVNKATNNQIKKALALAIFENTRNDLKLALKTNTQQLYTYQDITKVYATFKTFIENLKTQNKQKSICVDLVTGSLKFVDADALYNKMMEQKALEKKNKQQERKNKKQIDNEKASKK